MNYHTYIQDRSPHVPTLLDSGASRLLIYEFVGFLAGFDPTTLRQSYRKTSPEALVVLMQRLVKVLFAVHEFSTDTLCLLQRQLLHPPPQDHLPTLVTLTPSLGAEVADRLQELVAQAAKIPTRISTGCQSDLNAGNILFEHGEQDSYPLFIDFGVMVAGRGRSGSLGVDALTAAGPCAATWAGSAGQTVVAWSPRVAPWEVPKDSDELLTAPMGPAALF